ncbi:MAG TPA: hypothetical protein VLA74_06820, partial [Nitrososphaeraceae archaeon]|nr:hypothetical protein [Nitrososphaeraceae archaeon]
GECACPSLPGGTPIQCGDKCVDTATDESNCGGCGNTCQGDVTCQNGSCTTCPEGYAHPPLSEPPPLTNAPPLGCPGPSGGSNSFCDEVGGGDYFCVYRFEDGRQYTCYYHVDESQGVERYTLCGSP